MGNRQLNDLCECGHTRIFHSGPSHHGHCEVCDCPEFQFGRRVPTTEPSQSRTEVSIPTTVALLLVGILAGISFILIIILIISAVSLIVGNAQPTLPALILLVIYPILTLGIWLIVHSILKRIL